MIGAAQINYNATNGILFMITDNDKGLMIEHFMAQVKTEDLINIAFMKPMQIALRTHKNDKSVPADSLPTGLMIAAKSTINDNKYTLKRFKSIETEHKSLEDLQAKQLDNFISLLKKTQQKDEIEARRKSERVSLMSRAQDEQKQSKQPHHNGLEIGICVSMCTEDKKKLKSTMVGVADNIDQLIRSGISPDDIFVVVVVDGVTNVDKSLFQYFEELQRQSQIFLQQDEKLTLRKKYEHQIYHSQVEQDEPLNYSKFLFKQEQFEERVDSKFVNIRKKYDQILRIKKSIQNIKKENNKDNENLKMIVNRLADKQKNIMKKITQNKQDKSVVINEQSIMKQLASSEEECNQYINTRQQLAYVSVYRLPTTSLSQDCRQRQKQLDQNTIQFQSQMQSQRDSERLMNESIDRTSMRQSLLLKKGVVGKSIRYVNLMFCIKYKQEGKLSSHNWFLNGFCQQLNPKYTMLLDVGVRPYPDSIFKMYRHMKVNENVGAVCGYMRLVEEMVMDEETLDEEHIDCMTNFLLNIFDAQRAQQIESHYQHFLDKSFEALFRFIHVVPGSFSAYSMNALRSPGKKDELLRSYFRTIDDKVSSNKIVPSQFTTQSIIARVLLPKTIWKRFFLIDPDSEEQMLYNQNTYMAANRVLCLGIHKNGKDIAFLPNVYAQEEPIKRINDLMEEKRKDFNGSMFSFEKVKQEFQDVTRKREKFLVKFQFFYLSFTKFLIFFAPSLLIFAVQFATEIIQNNFLAKIFLIQSVTGIGAVIYATFANLVVFFYALCILAVFFFSIHLNSKDKKYLYYTHLISTVLGVYTVVTALVFIVQSFLSILKIGENYIQLQYIAQLNTFMTLQAARFVVTILRIFMYTSVAMIYLPTVVYVFFFGKFGILWEVVVGTPSYIFYLPTYICIIPIYSKCRLDDVPSGRHMKLKETWKVVKMIQVAKYLVWNVFMGVILIVLQSYLLAKFFVLLFLLVTFTILSLIRWIPGLIYTIRYKLQMRDKPLQPTEDQRNRNIANMRLRIFDTIKRFEEDFTFNIKSSFEQAAIQVEIKEFDRQAKDAQRDINQPGKILNKQPSKQSFGIPKAAIPPVARNQSIQMNNLVQLGQNNLGNKLQHLRDSSAPKPTFYPYQFGINKQARKVNDAPSGVPLELLLLKNKLGAEGGKNPEQKEEEIKLKKYQNFRTSIRPLAL